jgi:alpha-mannosidase
VTDAAGKLVPSQLVSLTPAELIVRQRALGLDSGSSRGPSSVSTLVFEVTVPPLGFATYYLTQAAPKGSGSNSDADKSARRRVACSGGEQTIAFTAGAVEGDDSSHVQIELDCATGQLASLSNPAERVGVHARQELLTYKAFDEPNSQAGGAYILRVDGSAVPVGEPSVTTVEGPVVTEVHQQFAAWASLTTRIYHNFEHFEQQWCIGAIPIGALRYRTCSRVSLFGPLVFLC